MDGEVRLFDGLGAGDVGRNYEDGDTPPREGGLGRHRRHPPCLRRRSDLFTKHAARRIDRLEIDLLRKFETQFGLRELAGD